ncbi:MAG: SsrA-binding protein SmpB [Planctomycetes bacterium]|nr:SsrA-binding protein SmpB [Planctomycetota bacterium]
MAKKKKQTDTPTIDNRRARFDYEIIDTLECGIVLEGSEVKSIREGKVSLGEGYVRAQVTPPALYLHSVNISPYGPAGLLNHIPTRTRKLLAQKGQIAKMVKAVSVKGFTIVPLQMYFKNGYVKVNIGLGKGRTKGDKRKAIGDREAKRDMDRAMSKRDR